MKTINEMDWTDGAGASLQKVGGILKKAEKERHDANEDYFSNPRILVMDLDTGSSFVIRTKHEEGGKTKGYGYRRCSSVRQRITAKLPTKKIIARLVRMAIRSFVPKDAPSEQYSVVVQKAIEDIAAEIADDSKWEASDDKYGSAVTAAVTDILGHTWTDRAGDSITCIEAIPAPFVVMDIEAVKEMAERVVVA
jgi:histone H3/H4|tara:strand:+ start:577 stop:1158 length:582 start_codon:yes stop_codon:yes gene_type:complete